MTKPAGPEPVEGQSQGDHKVGMKDRQELEQMLAARTREISVLERAVHISGAVDRPEGQDLYRQLNQQVAELLDVEMCAILLYNADQEALIGQAPAMGLPDDVIESYRIPFGEGNPARQYWEEAECLVINDVASEPLVQLMHFGELARRLHVRSMLLASLRRQGKLLGVIQLCNKRDGTGFNDDDVRLLSIFATQAAIAIQDALFLRWSRHHVEAMASLYEMTSVLAGAMNLDEMLDLVLGQIHCVLDYDLCLVGLATADGQVLQVRAADGKGAGGVLGVELPTDQGINAWIYREGKPSLVTDADSDPRRLHIEGRTEAIRSAVGAPLVADGQPIGTIYATCQQPHAFTQEHLDFLTITATQVAAAVQRARFLDQAWKRAEEMETLNTIGAVIASSLDVDYVLQTIYEQAGRIMDTSAFFVALYDPDADQLRFSLVYDQGQRLVPFAVSFSRSKGLTAHVIRAAEPLLVCDWESERDALLASIEPLVVGKPTVSWLGVPIVAQDQVLGAICAQSYEPHAFTNRQLRLLSAIANQAGISLRNARLYASVQQALQLAAGERDKLAHLHGVVADVQRAVALPAKLQVIAEGIHHLGWGRVSVSLRDTDLNVVEFVCAGYTPEDEAALRANLLPGSEWKKRLAEEFERFRIGQCYYLPWSDPWVRENVREVKSRQPGPAEPVPDAAERSPAEPSNMTTWDPRDLLYVPCCGREGRIAAIIGLSDPRDGRRPTAQSLHIIELFAQEAALTMENARLLGDLKLLNTDLQEMVNTQAQLLQTVEELASPVVPIMDGVIVLPLTGYVDERRAGQILQTLLTGVQEHDAQVIILDVTGLFSVDLQVAEHLMQSIRAARLLGTEAILVGIRPDVAEALVKLDVDLADVIIRSNLQSGFQYALRLLGRRLAAGLTEQV